MHCYYGNQNGYYGNTMMYKKDIIWALSGAFTRPSTTLFLFFKFVIFSYMSKYPGKKREEEEKK